MEATPGKGLEVGKEKAMQRVFTGVANSCWRWRLNVRNSQIPAQCKGQPRMYLTFLETLGVTKGKA